MIVEDSDKYVIELQAQIIRNRARSEIADEIAKKWLESPRAQKIIDNLMPDKNEIMSRVMNGIVDEIIQNWAERRMQ